MRILALVLLTFTLLLAGCTANDPDSGDAGNGLVDDAPTMEAPEGFTETGSVAFSMDQLNFVGMEPCSTPTQDCRKYEFTVNRSAAMSAVLTWSVPSNDFDLYLYQAGQQLALSGDFPPETEERIDHQLAAGTYELWVVPWAVFVDDFELSVSFA